MCFQGQVLGLGAAQRAGWLRRWTKCNKDIQHRPATCALKTKNNTGKGIECIGVGGGLL